MKLKTLDHPKFGKLVSVWCAGCGQFHGTLAEKWNGNEDKPTISFETDGKLPNMAYGEGNACYPTVTDGVISWSPESTHRLAGQSLPLQHEEAWRPEKVPWDAKLNSSSENSGNASK